MESMMKKIKVLIVLTAVLVLAMNESAQAWPWDNYTLQTNVRYGKTASEMADIYLPKSEKIHPALIMVHGGAWVGGDKSERAAIAAKFAAEGIAVVNINYRLLNMESGANPWPAQIQDVQLAVRWVRANAATLKIDPARVCAWGDSAGGHLALLAGTLEKPVAGDRSSILAKVSPKVACVVDLFGPTNFVAESAAPLKPVLKPLFGGRTADEARESYEQASPVTHVTPEVGPVLIVQGLNDKIVLADQSLRLEKELKKNGVQNKLITFNGGHWYVDIQPANQVPIIESQIMDWIKRRLRP